MKNPFRMFMDLYVDRLIYRSHKKAEKFRELQAAANRSGNHVMRYVIYENIKTPVDRQTPLIYTVQVKDGVLVRVPNTVTPTVTVYTDMPVVYGLINDETKIYVGNGVQKTIAPFGVWDAVRLGRLRWEGEAAAMKDMFLFDKQVLPMIMEELRLAKPRV